VKHSLKVKSQKLRMSTIEKLCNHISANLMAITIFCWWRWRIS